MKKTPKKTPTKKKTPISLYEVSVKIFGKVYSSTGETIYDALKNLKVIGKIGGMCVIQIKKGDMYKEKILNGRYLWRLFSGSSVMKQIAEKQLKQIFPE